MLIATTLMDLTTARVKLDIQAMAKIALVSYNKRSRSWAILIDILIDFYDSYESVTKMTNISKGNCHI